MGKLQGPHHDEAKFEHVWGKTYVEVFLNLTQVQNHLAQYLVRFTSRKNP